MMPDVACDGRQSGVIAGISTKHKALGLFRLILLTRRRCASLRHPPPACLTSQHLSTLNASVTFASFPPPLPNTLPQKNIPQVPVCLETSQSPIFLSRRLPAWATQPCSPTQWEAAAWEWARVAYPTNSQDFQVVQEASLCGHSAHAAAQEAALQPAACCQPCSQRLPRPPCLCCRLLSDGFRVAADAKHRTPSYFTHMHAVCCLNGCCAIGRGI